MYDSVFLNYWKGHGVTMDLKNLLTFKTILETGSFQEAARKLNYAQSTVTTQIQQLEQELHVKLFDKIGRKMVLTSAGSDLLPSVNQILETYNKMKNFSNNAELKGDLRIAIPESILTYQMQPILKEFHEKAPNVKLYLKTLNCFEIPYEVENGLVDLGIYYDVGEKSDQITNSKLGEHAISVIASAQKEVDSINFSDENKEFDVSFLSNDVDSIYQKHFEAMIKKRNITLNHRMEAGSIESIKRCVINNLGIAVFPDFVFTEELEKERIRKVPSPLDNLEIATIYSYHKKRWMSPNLACFIELLEAGKGDF